MPKSVSYIRKLKAFLFASVLVFVYACSSDDSDISGDGDSAPDGDSDNMNAELDDDSDSQNSESDADLSDFEADEEADMLPPEAPTALAVVAVSARNVRLEWDAYSETDVELCIERAEAGKDFKAVTCRPAAHGRWLDLALAPLAEYKYRARACNGDKCSDWAESESVGTPDSVLPPFEVTVHTYDDPEEVFLTSITDILHQSDYAALAAIKRDGTVIWEMSYNELCPITEIDPFEDRTIAVGAYGTLRIIDLDGRIIYEYLPDIAHHDIDRLSNGNLIYLIFDQIKQSEDYTILGDGIHIIDPMTDEILWEWMGIDHIPLSDNNPNDMNNVWLGIGHDWTHSNSIWFDEENSVIYLNVRNLNRIYKIKYPSGEVEWIMGDGGDFGEGIWSHSHDPHHIDANHILMFDNGLYRPNGNIFSQTIIIEYDEKAKSAEVVWRYREDPDFFSLGLGGAEYTRNGNIATCDGANGRIVEVNVAGEKTFELDFEVLFTLYKAIPIDISFFSEWGAQTTDYGWPRAAKQSH